MTQCVSYFLAPYIKCVPEPNSDRSTMFQARQEFHRGMQVQVLLLRHPARHKELPLLQIRDPDPEEENNCGAFDPADLDFIDRIVNYRTVQKN